ncbi:hypothetical protein ACFXTH_001169 [Malus domestica]
MCGSGRWRRRTLRIGLYSCEHFHGTHYRRYGGPAGRHHCHINYGIHNGHRIHDDYFAFSEFKCCRRLFFTVDVDIDDPGVVWFGQGCRFGEVEHYVSRLWGRVGEIDGQDDWIRKFQ